MSGGGCGSADEQRQLEPHRGWALLPQSAPRWGCSRSVVFWFDGALTPLLQPGRSQGVFTFLGLRDPSRGQALPGLEVSPQRGHVRLDGLPSQLHGFRKLAGLLLRPQPEVRLDGLGLGAEQESSQLSEAMELRRKAVETHVASLWADFEAGESLTARRITETKKGEDALRAARLEQGRQRTVKPEDDGP